MTDSLQGAGTVVFSLDQRGDAVTGAWQVTYADGSTIAGETSGVVSNVNVSLLLWPELAPLCRREATGTVSDTSLRLTYANAAPCGGGPTGTMRLVRQP